MMMQTLVLICALATPQADCGPDTADTVVQGPEAMSLVECGLHGQAYIAAGALAGYLDKDHYLKVSCISGRRLRTAQPAPVQRAAQVSGKFEPSD
jgi:hypothetical protein